MAGDSRLREWSYPGVRTLCVPSGGVERVAQHVMNMDLAQVDTILMMAIQCEITFLAPYPLGTSKGFLQIHDTLNISDLLLKITHYDRLMKEGGRSVVWTLPYANNFLKFNRRRARLHNLEPLNSREEAQAVWSRERMVEYIGKLKERLTEKKVKVMELGHIVGNIDQYEESDGVHLSGLARQDVMRRLVEAVKEYSVPPPQGPGYVGPQRSVNSRIAKRDRRLRQRWYSRSVNKTKLD